RRAQPRASAHGVVPTATDKGGLAHDRHVPVETGRPADHHPRDRARRAARRPAGACRSDDQCHGQAELTMASVSQASGDPLKGFFNTGVRPIADDAGDILQGNGMFKTPELRNVELNGPYFHNGDKGTLRQVVDFYDRGGDFRTALTNGQIRPLGPGESDKNALVAFMLALTDDRVRFEKAPFDHPSLDVPNDPNLPAVGAGGRPTPLGTFLGMSPFQP